MAAQDRLPARPADEGGELRRPRLVAAAHRRARGGWALAGTTV
jgi:hypothetical protein